MSIYVDVHCHLIHEKFDHDLEQVIEHAQQAGVGAIVVNGTDPISNRKAVELAQKHTIIKAAAGIYPVYAVQQLAPDLPFSVPKFDYLEELQWIEQAAAQGKIVGIGECGLDGHWVRQETFALQEKVFEAHIAIAQKYHLPLIIHSRKLEARVIDILKYHQASHVVMHCFGGKASLAIQAAGELGLSFSIPANAARNEGFRKLLKQLPASHILTETDAPYLAPTPQARNVPQNVKETIKLLAEFRQMTESEACQLVWDNYCRMFKVKSH